MPSGFQQSRPGGREVYQLPTSTNVFSVTIPVPLGKTLYVRLYSSINNAWQYTDYVL